MRGCCVEHHGYTLVAGGTGVGKDRVKRYLQLHQQVADAVQRGQVLRPQTQIGTRGHGNGVLGLVGYTNKGHACGLTGGTHDVDVNRCRPQRRFNGRGVGIVAHGGEQLRGCAPRFGAGNGLVGALAAWKGFKGATQHRFSKAGNVMGPNYKVQVG